VRIPLMVSLSNRGRSPFDSMSGFQFIITK
jgi:hypothetical protein